MGRSLEPLLPMSGRRSQFEVLRALGDCIVPFAHHWNTAVLVLVRWHFMREWLAPESGEAQSKMNMFEW